MSKRKFLINLVEIKKSGSIFKVSQMYHNERLLVNAN